MWHLQGGCGRRLSTVLFLGALALARRGEKRQPAKLYIYYRLANRDRLIVGMINMKPYGDQNTPIHNHVAAKIKQKVGSLKAVDSAAAKCQ